MFGLNIYSTSTISSMLKIRAGWNHISGRIILINGPVLALFIAYVYSTWKRELQHGVSALRAQALVWILFTPLTFAQGTANLGYTDSWSQIVKHLAYFIYLTPFVGVQMTRFNESRTLKHEMVTKEAIAVMNIRIVTCVLLGIAILFTIIGVATNQWIGDNLLRNSSNYSVTANAVGYLLIVGAVLLCITLIIGIVQVRRSTESFCLCVAYFITLYLGVAALLVAVIVYTEILARQWSYFISVVGCVFALQVAILVPTYTRCTMKQTTTRRTVRVTR